MPVYRTYLCPSCEKTFDFLHHPDDEPPPSFCPLCGANVSGKKRSRVKKVDRVLSPGLSERVKKLPRSGGAVGKSVNQVYRGMENASDDRMREAAEVLGVDPSTLAGMKMTDMKDNMRAGDMSQATTPADATKLLGNADLQQLPDSGNTGQQRTFTPFQANAQEFVKQAQTAAKATGTYSQPTGIKNVNLINSLHSAKSASVVAAGRMNKKG